MTEPMSLQWVEEHEDIGRLAMALHIDRTEHLTDKSDCGGMCIQDARRMLAYLNEHGQFIVRGTDLDALRQGFSQSKSVLATLNDRTYGHGGGADRRRIEDLQKIFQESTPVHTVRGHAIGPEGVPYGTNHDMDCPGCANTPFSLSPRSDHYWQS
jgi:hypothetical protein